jgi:hypothetical protein
MAYHDLKLLHQFFGFTTFALAWLVLINPEKKIFFWGFNFSFFPLGIIGFALLNNFGITPAVGLPFWVWMKNILAILIYALVFASYKWIKSKAKYLQFFLLALLFVTLFFGVFKIG